MAYRIRYYESVIVTLEQIHDYIVHELQAKEAGRKKIEDIMHKISALEIFPEAGFNADERYGKALDERYVTRGLTVGKDYIVLYFVDEQAQEVVVTHLLPTRSDYLKLFE